jgi:hypothetical protein
MVPVLVDLARAVRVMTDPRVATIPVSASPIRPAAMAIANPIPHETMTANLMGHVTLANASHIRPVIPASVNHMVLAMTVPQAVAEMIANPIPGLHVTT